MRKLKLFNVIMFAMLGMITNNGMAQTVPITGTVLSDDSIPLAGVTVKINRPNRATATNNNDQLTISANEGAMLEFSFVGFTRQKIKATAGMQVHLSKGDASQMTDVVVTAMGIKKERKALGYSVSDLSAQELMKNKNTNIVN